MSKKHVTKYTEITRSSHLTQCGASEAGLHGVAVFDTKFPHGDPTGSLFALLNTELAALKGELTKSMALTLPAGSDRAQRCLISSKTCISETVYLIAGVFAHHQWKDSFTKLQRSIARSVTTVHEDVVLTAVSVKVTVQHYISPC